MTSKDDGTDTADYWYNYGDKLTKVASTFAGEGTVAFAYGGDQKRREKAVTGGSTTTYRWDQGWNVVEATEGGTAEAYVRDAGGALLAGKAGSAWTYALRDHQGSTRGLYDGSKTATGSLEYTPYGESYAASGTSPRFRYTGKEWDATAKLYYFPYRYYSPERARWLTRDPLGMVDGPNVYAYVMGNPVNRVDPDGRASLHDIERMVMDYFWCVIAFVLGLFTIALGNLFHRGMDSLSVSARNCLSCIFVASRIVLAGILASVTVSGEYGTVLAVAFGMLLLACVAACVLVWALATLMGLFISFATLAAGCAFQMRERTIQRRCYFL